MQTESKSDLENKRLIAKLSKLNLHNEKQTCVTFKHMNDFSDLLPS
jgi:hypothetical protein